MEYYWEIVEHDGTTTLIPPDKVELVKSRWSNNQPIHTTTRSIPSHQIKKFQVTGKRYGAQRFLEADIAQAFKEPNTIESEQHGIKYEAVEAMWVKTTATMDRWHKYYSHILGYRLLGEEGGVALIAFRLATHDIDQSKTPYCTEEEVTKLTKF